MSKGSQDQEEIQEIVKLYTTELVNMNDIAGKIGRSYFYVHSTLMAAGIRSSDSFKRKQRGRNKLQETRLETPDQIMHNLLITSSWRTPINF